MKKNSYMILTILSNENRFYPAFEFAVRRYKKDLSDNLPGYSRDRKDFEEFLTTANYWYDFKSDLEDIKDYNSTLEYVAIDYRIPVIMVKYYLYKAGI